MKQRPKSKRTMSDYTRVRWDMLKAARLKCRQNVREAERSGDSDRIHTAYKLSSFLSDALPDAWKAVEEEVPDVVPE
jgi:hypothetical protein